MQSPGLSGTIPKLRGRPQTEQGILATRVQAIVEAISIRSSRAGHRPRASAEICGAATKLPHSTKSWDLPRLELDHDAGTDDCLTTAQVRKPDTAGPATAGRLRRGQVVRAGRRAAATDELSGSAV